MCDTHHCFEINELVTNSIRANGETPAGPGDVAKEYQLEIVFHLYIELICKFHHYNFRFFIVNIVFNGTEVK